METGEIHKLLARVYRIHRKCSFERFAQFGITPGQPRLLDFLAHSDGCMQKDISNDCDLEPATVTDILALMEKSDLVRRESDPNDRRVMRVYLTEKGIRTHRQVEEIFARLEDECFRGFSEQEKETYMLFLKRIYENLKKAECKDPDA